jgi:hypothetical protein
MITKKQWLGRCLSLVAIIIFAVSAGMKLHRGEDFLVEMTRLGISHDLILIIAIIEVSALIIYAIPKTAFLGAIILTAYLGGAVMTHFRVGDGIFTPVILGIILWAGLYFRESRLLNLLPLRK